jgi:hypothetical protein
VERNSLANYNAKEPYEKTENKNMDPMMIEASRSTRTAFSLTRWNDHLSRMRSYYIQARMAKGYIITAYFKLETFLWVRSMFLMPAFEPQITASPSIGYG